MSETRQQQLQTILLQLLPDDHSTVGNSSLWAQFQAAAQAARVTAITEDAFKAARDALVESGQAIKGKGRGGSTARATGPDRPDFDLKADPSTPDLLATPSIAKPVKSVKPKTAPQATPPGDPQVLSYRHPNRRKNNPEVGLVNEASDPEQPKTTWAYDPHLDPVLQWTGKTERTSFEVDTVSLHVHERIDAMSILSVLSKRQGKKNDKAATGGIQPGLFEAPFESLPLHSAVDFYKHDRGWANRLVAGDSLLVMNSLLQKEGMAGQVQMPGTVCLHASGHLDSGERVVVSFGPEHGALEQRQVEHALREAGELFPLPKMIVFCAFAFDPEAAKDIDAVKGITALKAQMNTDMLTEDLKKARSSNQSFWLMGQPDVHLMQTKGGLWQVEINGFDYFDTAKGELVSGGKGKIAAWSLDTDYDGRSLFPHQFFFPMAGKDEGWMKLKKDIRAELDEDLLKHFVGTVSLPFEAGANNMVAVKIVDDRGIESLKVMRLENLNHAN